MSGSLGGFIGSLPQVLGMLEGASGGALPAILAQLENAGLSERVQSWIGHGENLPVTAEELGTVFSPEQLDAWAEHEGTTPDAVLQALAEQLPDVAAKPGLGSSPP